MSIISKNTAKLIVMSLVLSSSIEAMAASSFKDMMSFLNTSTATDYNYVGARGGAVIPGKTEGNSDLQGTSGSTTSLYGLSLGRKFMDIFAAEVEYTYRNSSSLNNTSLVNGAVATNSKNTWGVKSQTLMLNLAADLITHDLIRPYVKLGMGFSKNKAEDYVQSTNANVTTWAGKNNTSFAWQAAFGLNFTTSKMIDTNFEYAFVNRGQFRTYDRSINVRSNSTTETENTAKKGNLKEQVITVGFKVKF
jgi:opacity protein-like surface antigen